MMRADLLDEPIAGLDEALAVVAGFDQALADGLLRPRASAAAGLVGLADAVAGTPLAALVAEAAEKAATGAAGRSTSSCWRPRGPRCSARCTTR